MEQGEHTKCALVLATCSIWPYAIYSKAPIDLSPEIQLENLTSLAKIYLGLIKPGMKIFGSQIMWQEDECSKYSTNSSVKLIFKLVPVQ